MLERPATAILCEPVRIITDTKARYTLPLDGQLEDFDESEEEAVLFVGPFRRMKIYVRNLDKLSRTCGRSTVRRVVQAPIAGGVEAQSGTGSLRGPLQPLGRGGAICKVALHVTTPRPRTCIVSYYVCGSHPFLQGKCHMWVRVHRLSRWYMQHNGA